MADSSRVWCTFEKTANNPGSRATRAGIGMKLESQGEGLLRDPKEMVAYTQKVLPVKFWPQKDVASPQL